MSASIRKDLLFPWPDECFYCHKDILDKEGAIHWHGTSDISLHKNCTAEFMAHLGSDIVKLKNLISENNKLNVF